MALSDGLIWRPNHGRKSERINSDYGFRRNSDRNHGSVQRIITQRQYYNKYKYTLQKSKKKTKVRVLQTMRRIITENVLLLSRVHDSID